MAAARRTTRREIRRDLIAKEPLFDLTTLLLVDTFYVPEGVPGAVFMLGKHAILSGHTQQSI